MRSFFSAADRQAVIALIAGAPASPLSRLTSVITSHQSRSVLLTSPQNTGEMKEGGTPLRRDAIFPNQIRNQMPAHILMVTNMAFDVLLLHVNCIYLQFRRVSRRAIVGLTINMKSSVVIQCS